jgi:hypothetical protein
MCKKGVEEILPSGCFPLWGRVGVTLTFFEFWKLVIEDFYRANFSNRNSGGALQSG